MLLAHKTTIKLSKDQCNIVGHMCYAAYKLWNVCNYERLHYKELNLPVDYPNWYYQKKAHKDDMWFKQLPSQTAQEVCKLLDKSWKSFYTLHKSKGIDNPRPPRFKHDKMPITYMQNAIVHETGSDIARFSLPKQLKQFMSVNYCKENEIHTVVIGDITNIRKDNDLGAKTNQKLHALPYKKLYNLSNYKLQLEGIRLIKQKESYSSQTSPFCKVVNQQNPEIKKVAV